jgi:thiamine-phosphate pyrophosphorylase
MYSYEVIAVTDRTLCRRDFLEQIERVAQAGPSAILLREKDLLPAEYQKMADEVNKLCARNKVGFIAHTFMREAEVLGCRSIHLPLPLLRQSAGNLKHFTCISTSVHSREEAQEAERLGASCLIAGHIYATDCKKDLKPRGLYFLQSVCSAVRIPVYAIGGITLENAEEPFSAGARGICVMSGFMRCEDPRNYLQALIREISGL